jgi:hypothetical protein
MNFANFVNSCTDAEFDKLEIEVSQRRRANNEAFARKHPTLTPYEIKLVECGESVKAIMEVRNRLDCNIGTARTIIDNYRSF